MKRLAEIGQDSRRVITTIAISLASLVTAIAISSFVPNVWLCDIASQLRLVWAIAFLILGLVMLLLRSRTGVAIVLAGFVLNAVPIVSLLTSVNCPVDTDAQTISILNFNTEFQHNDHCDLLEHLIADRNPDIIALVEIDKKWIDAIEAKTKRYPYRKIVIKGPGIALFSKFPLENCDVRYFGRSHHPRIIATARIGSQPLQIILAHPTTPKTNGGYLERNRELALLRDEIAPMPTPKILIGDLNCGPWSSAFSNLLMAGLHDSQQGFGPQPSWPARTGRVIDNVPIPPLVPIDHVLVSDSICVSQRVTGPSMQSDHLPVFVRVAIPK